jgi:hypothetical protein
LIFTLSSWPVLIRKRTVVGPRDKISAVSSTLNSTFSKIGLALYGRQLRPDADLHKGSSAVAEEIPQDRGDRGVTRRVLETGKFAGFRVTSWNEGKTLA